MKVAPCIVRAVDSGNIQRSPTFQAVFSYTASTLGNLPLIFDSGGIDVDRILANSTPAAKQLDIIDAGLYYGVVPTKEIPIATGLVDTWHGRSDIPEKERRAITRLYSEIKTKVHTIQMNCRNAALLEAGIPKDFLPGMRVPFRHEKDLRLVLPVETSVVQKVHEYYAQLKGRAVNRPIIKLYGDLVGAEPLEDELKGGMETARKQVKYFMDTRHKAIKGITKLLTGL